MTRKKPPPSSEGVEPSKEDVKKRAAAHEVRSAGRAVPAPSDVPLPSMGGAAVAASPGGDEEPHLADGLGDYSDDEDLSEEEMIELLTMDEKAKSFYFSDSNQFDMGKGTPNIADLVKNKAGLYDATKLAQLIDWSTEEISKYLSIAPSTLARYGATPPHQEKLDELVALVQEMVQDYPIESVRAWFNETGLALDNESPKEKILHGEMWMVRDLVEEIKSGCSFY